MNKDLIKVVKRVKKDETEKTQLIVNSKKVESNTQLQTINVVKNWIAERYENRQMEKVFSDSNILAWRIMSKNSNETIG